MTNPKKIELFYFTDCPSWRAAQQHLQAVLDQLEIESRIMLIKVETNADAAKFEFPGSPTIRLDGKDLFPVDHSDYALGCRVYATPQGLQGAPTKEMIRAKIKGLLPDSKSVIHTKGRE
jgi:hypothetical protein